MDTGGNDYKRGVMCRLQQEVCEKSWTKDIKLIEERLRGMDMALDLKAFELERKSSNRLVVLALIISGVNVLVLILTRLWMVGGGQ